jgi:hypothetical protein
MKKTPSTLRFATYNMLRDRKPNVVRGALLDIVDDHQPHAIAVQEARDYIDVLKRVPGYELYAKYAPQGAEQNGWLVREDVRCGSLRVIDLGGDGWTTADGHHHVGILATGVVLGGWLRALSIHLPPSINWPHGKPVGPPERVDDYKANMRTLLRYADDRDDCRSQLIDVKQREHYGSDHPLVTFKVRRVADRRGLLYVGDWNCRPGRDEGLYTASWLAERAHMEIGRVPNGEGHLWGIDFPMVAV